MNRNWKVLVQKRNKKGMREVVARTKPWRRPRRRFTYKEAVKIAATLKKQGRRARKQKVLSKKQVDDRLIRRWLRGDLDFDRDTMIRLAKTARDGKARLQVNYGKRSRAEQQALWNKYGYPRAARPGTSLHETGMAADVVFWARRWQNIGQSPAMRRAMKKHGLCLPVPNEKWHVQKGTTFRA